MCKKPPCKNIAVTKGNQVLELARSISDGTSAYVKINASGLEAVNCKKKTYIVTAISERFKRGNLRDFIESEIGIIFLIISETDTKEK